MTFNHNFADSPISSGAVLLHNGKLIVNANAQMQASNSTAIEVHEEIKAVYFKFEIMYINSYNLVKFIDNAARMQFL